MKILVAEDDPTLRGELAEFLRGEGHTVDMAADGSEAIGKIKRGRFDIVFLDWMMPRASGAEVLDRTRSSRSRTAVIVMTGYGSVDSAVEAMKSGARDFLQKPFETDAVHRAIDTMKKEKGSAAQGRRGSRNERGRAEVTAAFLHSKGGLLLGAKVKAGEKTVDQDLLVATLSVIQNFMRVSFPILRGKQLRTIVQGDHTLVTERGRDAFLTVILRGEEPDGLRERLRVQIRGFERANQVVLANVGIVENVRGADELLSSLVDDNG